MDDMTEPPLSAVLPGTPATGPVSPCDERMVPLHHEAAHR
jgi:hypothetical protein